MDRSVVVDIHSGLGNQMFQFAAGYALARRTGGDLLINRLETPGRSFLLDRFSMDLRFVQKGLRWGVIRAYARRLGLTRLAILWEATHAFDDRVAKLQPPAWISGYFQSELYFADIAEEIRRLYVLKQPLSRRGAEIAKAIGLVVMPVSIHVRRSDYLAGGDSFNFPLDVDYYRRATRLISALLGREPHYFIFSDDPGWAADALQFLPNRSLASVGPERPEEEIILMSRCAHHIIANSTFSWWGAWLNPNPAKTVIGPRRWFTPAGERRYNLCDLRPPQWILV